MTTATEEDTVSAANKTVLITTFQKEDVESVGIVSDPGNETSQRLEKLREEYGVC